MPARDRDTDLVTLTLRNDATTTILNQLLQLIRDILQGQPDEVFWTPQDWNPVARELYLATREAQEAAAQIAWETTTEVLRDLDLNPPKRRPALPQNLRGVPIAELWDRPAEQYRVATLIGTLDDDTDAIDAATRRATTLARDDVQLAQRVTDKTAYQATDGVIGHRRILHPEESQGGSCGLCIAAATRIYSVAELLPIHGGCNCGSAPVTADHDPGLTANRAFLERLYEDAGSTNGAALKRTRYKVVEHGELGPQLADPAHHHTADELQRKRQQRSQTVHTQREIDAELARIDKVLANVLASSAPADRKARRIAELERRRLHWSKLVPSGGPTYKYGSPEWIGWQRDDAQKKLAAAIADGNERMADQWRKYLAALNRRAAA